MISSKVIREEYKYFINDEEILYLRSMLSRVMKIDPNSNQDSKKYTVTSLYFDTPIKDDLEEKQSGIFYREKFRLRTYNGDNSIIKFESKKRANTAINKNSNSLSIDSARNIIDGNFLEFSEHDNQFLRESYIKLKSRGYRPSIIVEYDREAYYLPFGNIRITFDMDLRTYNSNTNILNIKNTSIPIFLDGMQVLEVKYSSALPSYIKTILSKIRGNRNAISKFVYAQKYIDASPWRDRIFSPF